MEQQAYSWLVRGPHARQPLGNAMIATDNLTQGSLSTSAPTQRCTDVQEPPLILEEITIDELAAREAYATHYTVR